MGRFDGAVCLVTGGSSGIGRAVAEGFAREGAAVVVAGRRTELGEVVVEELRREGARALFVRCDVADAEQVTAMMAHTLEQLGRLDCAVNNAAIEGPGLPTAEVDDETFDRVVAVNLKGVWLCLRAELQQMIRQGSGGAIVNMSSINALMAAPGASIYSATKQGVLGLTRTAAVEYAREGVRVNAVCAGPCRTPMLERVARRESGGDTAQALEEGSELIPVGRLGEPEEVAEAALWLCSRAASFVTAHALVVDGGLSAR